jgi:hypothetical protein
MRLLALTIVVIGGVLAGSACAQEDEGGAGGAADDGDLGERYVEAVAAVEQEQDSPLANDARCYGEAVVDAFGVDKLQEGQTPEEIEEDGVFDPVAAGIDVTEEEVEAVYDGLSECVDIRSFFIDELAAGAGAATPEQVACIDEAVDDDLLRAVFVTSLLAQGDPEDFDPGTMAELGVAIGPCLGG